MNILEFCAMPFGYICQKYSSQLYEKLVANTKSIYLLLHIYIQKLMDL